MKFLLVAFIRERLHDYRHVERKRFVFSVGGRIGAIHPPFVEFLQHGVCRRRDALTLNAVSLSLEASYGFR